VLEVERTLADAVEFMLADLTERHSQPPASDGFLRLYADDERFGQVFANLHERLNGHFTDINGRARASHYYWAENSRELIALIDEIPETIDTLAQAGFDVVFRADYDAALQRCKPWLESIRGSTIPDVFEPITIVKYEPVFTRPETTVKLQKRSTPVPLQLIGEGSYAQVFSFTDPDYGFKVAVKRARKGIDERDLYRFKKEFEVLSGLSYPYIVDVYKYDDSRNEYSMEFCEETLRKYIGKRNNKLAFATRKRIALQFLYGVNYLHSQDVLHRDLSLQNVLLKVFESGAVLVKLSDFGLAKDLTSTFTRTKTEMRGTIRDPLLGNFKDYEITHEVYGIGWMLQYIFTGKESLPRDDRDEVSRIVRKCTTSDGKQRYADVRSIIVDVEPLDVAPPGASA
jgi:hypothetical protein